MQPLEKNRVRFEHDILMMQVQLEHYATRKKWVRIVSYSIAIITGAAVLAMLPALIHDFGPGTPRPSDWTPTRVIFISFFLAFVVGHIVTDQYICADDRFVRHLTYWINEKRQRH